MTLDPSLGAQYIPPQGQTDVSKELQAAKAKAKEMQAEQVDLKEDIFDDQQEAFNPWAANRGIKEKMKELKQRVPVKAETPKQAKQVESKEAALKQGQDSAKEFVKSNPELKEEGLTKLLQQLLEGDHSPEDILKMAQDLHEDPSMVDQVLEFLKENSPHELEKKIRKAQDDFRARKRREISAGKNIQEQALEFAAQGLGSPTFLRNLYRKITGEEMQEHELFDELSGNFTYSQLLEAVRFLLHALGDDIKSKGPSIPRAELQTLFVEVRKLQLVLGVYRFFQSRMDLLYDYFDRYDLDYPEGLTFQIIARSYVKLSKDHYPNSQKMLALGADFGLEENVPGLMIVLTQMRDAVRNTSQRLFYSPKHRQDMLSAYIEAIEQLDVLLDEEEEEEEEEES